MGIPALPLAHLRVLDLTRVLAGPLATMILGDLGADVMKIERPGSGDESRGWGPPFDARGESAYFLCCNRNKLSVAVELDDPAGQTLVRDLIAGADVVVENFRAGSLAERGLDAGALLERHPKLVWCTISGFGPGSSRPGYDFVVQAEAGWMAITGERGAAPMKVGVALADVICGKDAAVAILGTLVALRSGLGVERHLSVSLHHGAVASLVNVAQNALVTGGEPERWGNAHPNLVPYELFRATDGELVIAVGNDAQYAALVRVLGDPALADARYATNPGRLAHRSEIVQAIAAVVVRRPVSAWMAELSRVGVPAGVVRGVRDALSDVTASPLTGIGPQAPGTVRRPPPRLDEHGALVRAHGWGAFDRT